MFDTLNEAAKHYRLRDSTMSNAKIAERLGIENGEGDATGLPTCCFFSAGGNIVAIRTKVDELFVFHVYERVQIRMEGIGDMIE